MLRRRILYLGVLLAAYLGQILDVGYLFHFTFYAVIGMPVLGLLISLPSMLGCRAELSASASRVQRGKEAAWELALANRFHLPLARTSFRLRVVNRLTGETHTVRTAVQSASGAEDRRWTMDTDHCGMLECHVDKIWVCDCLGLFALPVRAPGMVTTMAAPLPEDPGPLDLPEGTGFSIPQPGKKAVLGENYELRPYREGDSLRMIHWKMTAKRDELVTREPPQDDRPLPVLTFNHYGLMDEVDRTLDKLEGYSEALLDQERVHEIRWVHPETGAVRAYRIGGERDWENCLAAILTDPAPVRGKSILNQAAAQVQGAGGAIYQIHISGKEESHGEA